VMPKVCKTCQTEKPITSFRTRVRKDRPNPTTSKSCYTCEKRPYYKAHNERRNKRRATDQDWRSEDLSRQHKGRHGIDHDQRQAIIEAQGGVCGICKSPTSGWVTDHDHSCCPGKKSCGSCIRGVLCNNCNAGLGMFGDDPERLSNAVEYLMSYRTVTTNA